MDVCCYIGLMDQEQFYARCAYLLGVKHEYHEPLKPSRFPDRHGNIHNTYKGRYNGRTPGNGRFPDSGVIRDYGSTIHVTLTTPPLSGQFSSFEDALLAIEAAMHTHTEKVALQINEEAAAALVDNPVGYRIAGPEEADLARRQLARGHQQVREAMARRMSPAECAEMEALTNQVHAEIGDLLKTRTDPPYHERRRAKLLCPRCERLVDKRCDEEICGYLG